MDIYFDNAATSSPKPQTVVDEVVRALQEYNANPGRSGHAASLQAARIVFSARERLTELLHGEEGGCVSFAFNCTDALNLAIKGILRKGSHAIATMLEHNSVLRPLCGLSERGQISLSLIAPKENGFIDPQDIRRALRKETALIVCTHASNVTGAIQPVAAIGEIAKKAGVPFLIDGAQTLGTMPVDVRRLKCDMYAFPGHKGLLGPQGSGGLYLRKGLVLSTVREGGTGTDSDKMLQPSEAPERYEAGTVNTPGIAGLMRGTEYVMAKLSQIMMHERELTGALWEELQKMPDTIVYSPSEEAARAGIVAFNMGDFTSSALADALGRRGIAVRGGLHCAPCAHRMLGTLQRGAVRVSVGHANSFDEVERFLKSLHAIARE